MPPDQRPVHALCLAALVAALLLFLPGLSGDFLFDDAINITDNPSLRLPALSLDYLLEAAFSNPAGAGQRWLSMLSLALNQYWLGPGPEGYKIVNLIIHGLCALAFYGFLITSLSLQAADRRGPPYKPALIPVLAGATALWWLISPINLSPALYIVQRMTSLSALFIWICLSAWILFRRAAAGGQLHRAALWLALSALSAILSVSCKENGALILLFLLLLEVLVLRRFIGHAGHARFFFRSLGALIVGSLLAVAAFLLLNPDWLPRTYGTRDFSPMERVMTQGRVLWFYFAQTLLPRSDLLGLHQDDWVVSTGWLSPLSTLLSWAGWGLYVILSIRLRHRYPLASFGLLFFLAAHSMEASFLSLEMVHEHRNYLPSGGLLLAFSLRAADLLRSLQGRPRTLAITAAAFYLCLIATLLSLRVATWGNLVDHALTEATHHPHSPRSQYQWGRVQLMMWETNRDPKWLEGAHATFLRLLERFPDNADALTGLISLSSTQPAYASEAEHWRQVFIRRLDGHRLHHSLVGQLPAFLQSCSQAEACRSVLPVINQRFLDNPHASPRFKALWLVKIAYYFSDNGQPGEAEPLLRRAVTIDPASPDVARVLGLFYLQRGLLDEAEAILTPLDRGLYGLTNPSIGYFLHTIRELRKKNAPPP